MNNVIRKIVLTFIPFLFLSISCFGQILFKGLELGMTKKEAKKEFRDNKAEYTNIDIGNNWIYRTSIPNMHFLPDKGLVRIDFFLKGTLLGGIGYQNTTNGLEMTRQFFENLGYKVFYENKYWKYPLNFSSDYGLIMTDSKNSKVIHLFPSHPPGKLNQHTVGLILIEHDIFMEAYKERIKSILTKQKKSGF